MQIPPSHYLKSSVFFIYHSNYSPSHVYRLTCSLSYQNSKPLFFIVQYPMLSTGYYAKSASKFPKLLVNLSLVSAGQVAANVTCSNPLRTEIIILQLHMCRFHSCFQYSVTYGEPMMSICDHRSATMICMGMMDQWVFTATDSPCFVESH